jgi:transposase-like protein
VNFGDLRFHDEEKARKWFETERWPNGITCPHCGNFDQLQITPLRGKSHRPGLYCCNECRRQFTVTVGTAMHRSKIPLYKWLMALHLISSSKKKVSIRQLSHKLGIAYHSAWSLAHHIREGMGGQEIKPTLKGSAPSITGERSNFQAADGPNGRSS